MTSLKGQLLVSGGGLFDPNFRHTVVLVGEHGPEGALGVVLNRPTGISVAEAVPGLASLVAPDTPLYEGGPVRVGEPVLVAEVARADLLDLPVFGRVGFLTGDVPPEIGAAVRRARVYSGYAGWGPGQLEGELERGDWILHPAREEHVFTDDPDALWRRVLEEKGPDFRALSRMPFDPSMN